MASPDDARRTLAGFAAERARCAWQAGNLVQAARLNRQCADFDPGHAERWQALADQIRSAADRADLSVTLAVRLALAGIEPDDPGLTKIRDHNRALGIPQSAAAPGGAQPEAGE